VLYVSLVATVILVLTAHVAARRSPQPITGGWFILATVVFALGPVCVGAFLPAVIGVAGLLFGSLVVWSVARERLKSFLPFSVVAVVVPFGYAGWWAWGRYEAAVELRAQYPFESMADRVPEAVRGAVPTGAAVARLARFEREAAPRYDLYDYQFETIHNTTVEQFVNSPGFGVSRGIRYPTDAGLRHRTERRDPPPAQPSPPGSPWAGDEFGPLADRGGLDDLHLDGVLDFVNREGWGYLRGKRQVAGFLPHAFSRVPEAKAWRVESVYLVGLLKHAEPVVYLTDRLPAMADAATAPTRPVDAFEAAGLKEIRAGDDGYAGRRGDEVRFIGAVRSAAACVGCHGGERGDLLGAFAYRLRAAP
jgi:hypothetical protein